METVIIDSGAILAILDMDSLFHREARVILKQLKDMWAVPLLTNFIVAESFSVLSASLGPDAARTWMRHNIWAVERVREDDESRARDIILAGDGEDISYTDATTIAVMERLGVNRVFSFKPVYEKKGFRTVAVE
jgi:predicted nucleic acid-binding protein